MKRMKRILKLELIDSGTGGKYILGKIDYVSLLWVKGYLNEISKKKNPLYKLIKKIILKKLNSFLKDLGQKQMIKPDDLLEFTKFYVSTKNQVDCDFISGTVSNIDVSDTVQYFNLKVDAEHYRKHNKYYPRVKLVISTSPSIHPFINIHREIDDDGCIRSVTVERMFLDITEDDAYRATWKAMCKYIKLVIETDWENNDD